MVANSKSAQFSLQKKQNIEGNWTQKPPLQLENILEYKSMHSG